MVTGTSLPWHWLPGAESRCLWARVSARSPIVTVTVPGWPGSGPPGPAAGPATAGAAAAETGRQGKAYDGGRPVQLE